MSLRTLLSAPQTLESPDSKVTSTGLLHEVPLVALLGAAPVVCVAWVYTSGPVVRAYSDEFLQNTCRLSH